MVVFAVLIKDDIPTILGYCINEFGHREDVQRALIEYYAGKISKKPSKWVFKPHLVVIDDNTRISLICVPNFLTDFRDNPIFFFSDNKIKIVRPDSSFDNNIDFVMSEMRAFSLFEKITERERIIIDKNVAQVIVEVRDNKDKITVKKYCARRFCFKDVPEIDKNDFAKILLLNGG